MSLSDNPTIIYPLTLDGLADITADSLNLQGIGAGVLITDNTGNVSATDEINVNKITPAASLTVDGDLNLTSGHMYKIDGNQLSTTNITEGSNLYYTPTRSRLAITSASALNGLSYNNSTGVLSLDLASGSSTGALSSTDFSRFNALSSSKWSNSGTSIINNNAGSVLVSNGLNVSGTTTLTGQVNASTNLNVGTTLTAFHVRVNGSNIPQAIINPELLTTNTHGGGANNNVVCANEGDISNGNLTAYTANTGTNGPMIEMIRSNSNTLTAFGQVVDGQNCGEIRFKGFIQNPLHTSIAKIIGRARGTLTGANYGGSLELQTGNLNAITQTTKIYIDDNTWITNGNLGVGTSYTSSSKLTVAGDTNISGVYRINGTQLSTLNVPENTNLYYTDTRFDSRFATKTTTNLAEGTNFYYTDTRARNAISVSAPLSYNASTGLLSLSTNNTSVFDKRLAKPSDFPATSYSVGFGSWNNNNTNPWADCISLNTWADATGGKPNFITFNKDVPAMRIYQGAFGSGTTFTTFRDAVMAESNGTVNLGNATTESNVALNVKKTSGGIKAKIETASANDAELWLKNTTGSFSWYSHNSVNSMRLYNYNTSSDLMTIKGDGNLGIGTNNPTNKLEIVDATSTTIKVRATDSTSACQLFLQNDSTIAGGGIYLNGSATSVNANFLHMQNNLGAIYILPKLGTFTYNRGRLEIQNDGTYDPSGNAVLQFKTAASDMGYFYMRESDNAFISSQPIKMPRQSTIDGAPMYWIMAYFRGPQQAAQMPSATNHVFDTGSFEIKSSTSSALIMLNWSNWKTVAGNSYLSISLYRSTGTFLQSFNTGGMYFNSTNVHMPQSWAQVLPIGASWGAGNYYLRIVYQTAGNTIDANDYMNIVIQETQLLY
jgi:hypothetical protein